MARFDDEKTSGILKSFYDDENEDKARLRAQKHGLQYADLRGYPFEKDGLEMISLQQAQDWEMVPFVKDGKKVKIGSVDPSNQSVKDFIAILNEEGYEIEHYVISPISLKKAWPLYQELEKVKRTNLGDLGIQSGNLVELVNGQKTISEITPLLENSLSPGKKTSDLVELLVATAIATDASDIHLEPQENFVQLRLRLDGVLQPIIQYDHQMHQRLVSRLKLMSGLKLNVESEPQDGRFSITIGKEEVEVRSSVLPGAFGESIVMRLLNPDSANVQLESLGMSQELLTVIRRETSKPNGLVLTTGPTGSGKSTAIYSILKEIYEPGIKVITIENPVEYHLEGIVQTQVNKDKGYDFYDGLRSALRQDPDVIMVGEIRDPNTAKTAIQAALTGHLVFSTLHTNNAAGAIPRLIDLDALPDTLGPSLNLILAQRLVRLVSKQHRLEVPLEDADKRQLEQLFEGLDRHWWEDLLNRGTKFLANPEVDDKEAYHGRTGVFEAIVVDNKIEELIRENKGVNAIRIAQKNQGLPTVAQDAAIKALKGQTTFEEVSRVVSLF